MRYIRRNMTSDEATICGSCPYRIGSRQSECKCRDFWIWFFRKNGILIAYTRLLKKGR